MYNKEYYNNKIQDKITQRGKIINRLIQDIYAFVKDNEEIVQEVNKLAEIIKAEETQTSKQEVKTGTTNETNNPKIEKKVVASET